MKDSKQVSYLEETQYVLYYNKICYYMHIIIRVNQPKMCNIIHIHVSCSSLLIFSP